MLPCVFLQLPWQNPRSTCNFFEKTIGLPWIFLIFWRMFDHQSMRQHIVQGLFFDGKSGKQITKIQNQAGSDFSKIAPERPPKTDGISI